MYSSLNFKRRDFNFEIEILTWKEKYDGKK